MTQFQIRKDDFSVKRLVETDNTAPLQDGDIKVKINRFAFTANNITYAATGDILGYWQFFPPVGSDTKGWGVIPVWGFAEVIASNQGELEIGERLFGYFPPAEEMTMTPVKVSSQRLIDGSPHRAKLPPGYNNYRRVNAEPGYNSDMDNERMLLWPLFITSFCLWDALQDKSWYGAEQVIIISASSKTSIGLAYALHDDATSPTVVGITSNRNIELVNSLGLYDQSISYDALTDIDTTLATVIVDMSGNKAVLTQLYKQLGENMKYCINVGLTHWHETDANDISTDGRSEFFFAPAHIQKRLKDWGPEGFEQKTSSYIMQTVAKTRDWLKLQRVAGLEGLETVYDDVCEGRVAPDAGIIVEL